MLTDLDAAKGSFALSVNLSPLIEMSHNHIIVNEESARQGLSMALQARKMLKLVEDIRKVHVTPHVKFQRSINDLAKFYEETLTGIEESLSLKLNTWIEDVDKRTEMTGVHSEISVPDGTFKKFKEWVFEVTDFDKIPKEFMCLDEKKIKEAIKIGVRNIEGIKINEIETSKLRVK